MSGEQEKEREKEVVFGPEHYGGADNPHEVIKCLKAWGLEQDALLWQVGRYLGRVFRKGTALEQCWKAAFYLCRRIAELEGREPEYYNDILKHARDVGEVFVNGQQVEVAPLENFKVSEGPTSGVPLVPLESAPLEGKLVRRGAGGKLVNPRAYELGHRLRQGVEPGRAEAHEVADALRCAYPWVLPTPSRPVDKEQQRRARNLARRITAAGRPSDHLTTADFCEVAELLLAAYTDSHGETCEQPTATPEA